ncbi:hypothetical protein BFW38_13685 [Terasakiispira papahanaumokuakeensis]|uniref:histidine kinase n=1 Tax=Terasakiispira papahanaumokuakeensis TaxID=197479 RepID=A0A1E2VBQ1_9GAMM|nr:ATP-binding protein [Terasakiispira papahanaumokuakeensis]ODC04427.1 hypothetical protein BFW38_13685 [Terasakiispira papahanaumokuakeensis]
MRRFWPRRLAGQLIVGLLLTLLLGQMVTLSLFQEDRSRLLQESGQRHLLQRLASAPALLVATDPELEPILLRNLSTPLMQLRMTATPELQGIPAPRIARFLSQVVGMPLAVEASRVPQQADCQQPVSDRPSMPRDRGGRHRGLMHPHGVACQGILQVAIELPDGRWLHADMIPKPPTDPWPDWLIPGLLVTALAMVLVVVLSIRRLTRPLRNLSAAALALGRGEGAQLDEQGPEDLREVIRAFNRMQAQLNKHLDDRTRLLAALSHDLKTPITRMRLSVEMMPDNEDRQALLRSLAEMSQLAETTLDFVRGASGEDARLLDLDALLDSLIEDRLVSSQAITYHSPGRALLRGRSTALRRLFDNLIENALKYGHQVDISLQQAASGHEWQIMLKDQGPGIPEADQARMFEPFQRLEDSRSRDTGGTGLGLSIARTLARQHGGDIELANRYDKGQICGLCVLVTLPCEGTD